MKQLKQSWLYNQYRNAYPLPTPEVGAWTSTMQLTMILIGRKGWWWIEISNKKEERKKGQRGKPVNRLL